MILSKDDSAADQIYDRDELAKLAKLAIGSRTIREFANQSGLSEGFLYRLTNGKLVSAPTRRSIVRLASDECRPQNGVTLAKLMSAAGYNFDSTISVRPKINSENGETLPADVQNSAFPAYLTARVLLESGQLNQRFSTQNQREMFVISSRDGKDIVGIPAFCAPDAVDGEIMEAKRNLLMAYSIFADEIKNKFVMILTNQQSFFDGFDEAKVVGTNGEFYIMLTEDFHTFIRQRQVQVVDISGEPAGAYDKPASYDFTGARSKTL